MQTGKNTLQQDRTMNRGITKPNRFVEEKRKKIIETARQNQEVKTGSTTDVDNRGTDSETRRKSLLPTVKRSKPKVISYSKADENRVSDSIQKLLSVYQNSRADKIPDGPHSPVAELKKSKVYAKLSRNNVNKFAEAQVPHKSSLTNTDKLYKRRINPVQGVNSAAKDVGNQNRKTEDIRTERSLQKSKLTPEISRTEIPAESVETEEEQDKDAKPCDEIIPLLTPDRTTNSPANQIHSFITNYLEEDLDRRCDNKNKLELFVPENSSNAFPVCSKKATDNIPCSDVVKPEVASGAREFIIMLRRRNSEPYASKSCILQYSRREEDYPLSSAGSNAWDFGYQNYCIWEQGPIRSIKPYWEVSLFKSNKSSSALNSSAGVLSVSTQKDTGGILINGNFGSRYQGRTVIPDRVPTPWIADLESCKSVVRRVPFVGSMESANGLPLEPLPFWTPPKPMSRTRGISKDDHYQHPAHLFVYVKSSQKKLVSVDSSGSLVGTFANRKVHKMKKILGSVSEARVTTSCKNIILVALWAVVVLTGGLAFFMYFLARRPTLLSLTPPIPEFLRRKS